MTRPIAALILIAAVSWPAIARAVDEPLECIIEPHRIVKIASPVTGIMVDVTVDRGDIVKQGQVVGRLNSEVERATVELARARSASMAQIKAAEAQVGFERRRKSRHAKLYKKRVISEQNIDLVETELALREQELQAAKEQSRIAQLELQRSQAILEIRTIRSSIDGIVVARSLSPGEFVLNEGQIITLAQIDPLNVEVFAPIRLYPEIKVGMTAKVMPEAPVGGALTATVTIVDSVFDAASGTFGVRLELPNPDLKIPAGLHCLVKFDAN